jgi:hypothetical protein
MIQERKLRKRILGLVVLIIFVVSVFGYYSFYFRQLSEANQLTFDPGYRYQQIGPVAVRTLEQLGVKSTKNPSLNFTVGTIRYAYNSTEVQWTGNFSSGNAIAFYELSHFDASQSERYSNGTVLLHHCIHCIHYTLAISLGRIGNTFGFLYTNSSNLFCNLSLPRSDGNCNEILFVNFQNSTASQIRRYKLTTSTYDNETVYFYDSDPSHYLLNSHLTFSVGTFEGYSWCPIYGVDNMSRLLCRFNPDYKYQEITSMNVSDLHSMGRFAWQNVALNYSFANGILGVTVDSAPSCDVEKPITQANCQGMLLVGFEVANPPPNSGIPSDIAYPVQVGKTETFYLYPTNSGIHQHLYLMFGSYVGDYKGLLSSSYAYGMGYSTYP